MTSEFTGRNAPRILFTFEDESSGDTCALVIHKEMHSVPNPLSVKPMLFLPQTPKLVRTSYYNSIARVIRNANETPAVMATAVFVHKTADGTPFLEVQLTPEGRAYLEDFYTNWDPTYIRCNYQRYNPGSSNAQAMFEQDFPAELRAALKALSLAPAKG